MAMNWTHYFDALNIWKQSGIYFAVLVAVVIVINIGVHFLIQYLERVNQRKGSLWWGRVINAIGWPLQVYIWALLLCFALYVLSNLLFNHPSHRWMNPLISFISLAVFTWFLFRVIENAEHFYLRRLPISGNHSQEKSAIKALSHLLQLVVLIIAGLFLLGILQVPIAGLLTFGGMSSIVMAYAAKGMFSNYFSGIAIYLGREFAVGDSIRSPDRDIEGVVENIGWRATLIRRLDKQLMYVPNDVFNNILLINASRVSNYRIKYTLGLRYQDLDKLPKIINEIQALLNKNENLSQHEARRIYLDAFAERSINLVLEVLTLTSDYNEYLSVRQKLMLAVADIVLKNGADFALPAQVVYTSMAAAR